MTSLSWVLVLVLYLRWVVGEQTARVPIVAMVLLSQSVTRVRSLLAAAQFNQPGASNLAGRQGQAEGVFHGERRRRVAHEEALQEGASEPQTAVHWLGVCAFSAIRIQSFHVVVGE